MFLTRISDRCKRLYVDIAVVRNKLAHKNFEEGYKELIVSYKTINENTYNVFIVDIAGVEPIPIFRHESF